MHFCAHKRLIISTLLAVRPSQRHAGAVATTVAMGDFWAPTQEILQGADPMVRKPKVRARAVSSQSL